jgi:Ser/Thr protein kinase RdoA (MazF antagonist)
MSNWNQSVVSAPVELDESDDELRAYERQLAQKLRAALKEGKISEGNREFARSLLRGYERYDSFTDRQRPHVERLLRVASGRGPDAELALRLRVALEAGEIALRDRDFVRSLLRGYQRYGSFTERQRPYAERLAGPSGDCDVEGR